MAKTSCEFNTAEQSTKAWFRTKGLIDTFNRILNLNEFRKQNAKWSNYARLKFGTTGNLFLETYGGKKAIPNREVFDKIDGSKYMEGLIGLNDKPVIKPGVEEVFKSNPELANQVYEILGFKEKYKGAEKGDLINELKQITDPYLKEFADLFIQFNINIPLYYSKGNDYAYVVPDNTLIISKGSVGIIKQKSIIHEVLHGGTTNNLLSNSDFKNRIEAIINSIKKSDQQGRIAFSYELQNADEFISGLADKAFGAYLKQNGVFDEVFVLVKNNISFEKGFKITPQQKQQAQQLYQSFLDVYLQDFEQVEKILKEENIIEKDCTGGGKLKAEKGLQTNFTKGGKWKLIKDLKGYPTHKEGGVDLTIGKNGVSIRNGNTEFTAKHGLVIPKN